MEENPVEAKQHIKELGSLATQAQQALQTNNLKELGNLMNQAQLELTALEVSHPKLDILINAAKKAGALGAKLTGGGIGGTMLALAPNQEVANKIIASLEAAGANEVWTQTYPTH